ncbi:DUF4105 domain-containing protein [Pelagicoccus sp. SDUM812002]|uniref:lipoprotein N-acyltransferase Lnb domain-containing protein n=1 Tax=Pelagicoccus sp. SDUM812002 TaxID=3041266 RepID=UPI0028122A3B|nr:DUF4105 domain-containing protein [Pelagicoccus sp. SDUM812002]
MKLELARPISSLLLRIALQLPLLVAVVLIGQFVGIPSGVSALIAVVGWIACIWLLSLRKLLGLAAILVAISAIVYFFHQPSNDRDWRPEVARLPRSIIEGDTLRVENLRDFRWDSQTEFEERWLQTVYDLRTLEQLDAIVVPFGDSDLAAHVMLSFGFADGRHLAVSIEARAEMGETYSLIGGAARQLELFYLFGTEADLLGLRILHRGDRVYSFPLDVDAGFAKELLLELSEAANQLNERPKFYATLRHNCTTSLLRHVNRISDQPLAFSREILFPAQLGKLLHQLDLIETDLDWPEAKEAFRVDETIRSAKDLTTAFSDALRSSRP